MKKTLMDYIPMKYRHMISQISDERCYGAGYWVYLHEGFLTERGCGCHTIHEDTIADVLSQLRDVVVE
ncbi:MAG TPA: hypothetical protein VJ869_16140 [Sphaerochaeta sp.]|nr:hypothetical protein [Sphaerochaeta sp.]